MTANEAGSATLLIVRHGRTGGNAERYLGWTDEPLDEVGHQQAQSVAQTLAEARIDMICSSPFSRTMETVRPLATARHLPIHRHDDLKELNFGAYQGLSKADHPLKVRSAHALEAVPGGESLADLQQRCRAFLTTIGPHMAAGETLVVATHFWTSRVLVGTMLGLPLLTMMDRLDYKPSTGSILRVDCQAAAPGQWIVAATRPVTSAASVRA
jgi:probable phosphoglycerate mutase